MKSLSKALALCYLLLFLGALSACYYQPGSIVSEDPLLYAERFKDKEIGENEVIVQTSSNSFTTRIANNSYIYRRYHNDILASETEYFDFNLLLKHGEQKSNDIYTQKLSSTGSFVKGKGHGKFLGFYDSGELESEYHFFEGERHGVRKVYFKSGALKSEESYSHGRIISPRKIYHVNGKLRTELPIKARRVQYSTFYEVLGKFSIFDENGQLICNGEVGKDSLMTPDCSPFFDALEDPVESMPEFPGGEAAGLRYLYSKLKYPDKARQNDIQGLVIVFFVVNEDGSRSDFKIIRSPDASLSMAAVSALREMPNWKPGMQNGKAVKVGYHFPVNFNLN